MKNVFILLFTFFSIIGYSQNVGINNTDPQTALDVNGLLRLRKQYWAVPNNFPAFPSSFGGFVVMESAPSNFTFWLPLRPYGTILLLENKTSYNATVNGVIMKPEILMMFLFGDEGWVPISGLEKALSLPFAANYGEPTNPAFQINVQNNNTGIEVNNIALAGATEPAIRATSNGTSVVEIESNNASKNSIGAFIHNDLPNAAGIMTSIGVVSDSAVALSVSGINNALVVNGSSTGSKAAVSILNLGQGQGMKVEQINSTSTQNAMHITSSSKGSALKVEVNKSFGQQTPNEASALEIGNGFIKVDQSAPFRSVFKHVTNAFNVNGNATSVFYSGALPTDILFVQKSLPYIGTGVLVWWDPSLLVWKIATENITNMPVGVTFHVLVIKTE